MANTKYVLSKIKIEGVLRDIIAKTTGDYVTVSYKGADVPLTTALSGIIADIGNLPIDTAIDAKISAAIDGLIGGAPETYDTLKEIADYIADHKDVADALNEAVGKKADKEVVDGIQTSLTSLEETVNALKAKVEAMPSVTEDDIAGWNAKADKSVATASADGLMSKEDKARLDGLKGVHCSADQPEDMKDGELWVQVIDE